MCNESFVFTEDPTDLLKINIGCCDLSTTAWRQVDLHCRTALGMEVQYMSAYAYVSRMLSRSKNSQREEISS